MRASLVAQRLRHLPAMQETQVQSLDWKGPLEKEMATHSNILTWRIPWKEEPSRLQSMGSERVGHEWSTSLGDRDGEDTWTQGLFISMYDKIHYKLKKKAGGMIIEQWKTFRVTKHILCSNPRHFFGFSMVGRKEVPMRGENEQVRNLMTIES